jgi:hypothetical protein
MGHDTYIIDQNGAPLRVRWLNAPSMVRLPLTRSRNSYYLITCALTSICHCKARPNRTAVPKLKAEKLKESVLCFLH